MRIPAVISLLSLVGLLATSGPAAARPVCGDAVIADWSDGRIDGVYAPACYAKALDTLPEDVRAYSTAAEDISQAMRARIRAEARRPRPAPGEPADGSRRLSVREPARADADETASALGAATAAPVPLPLLVVGTVALVLLAAGSTRLIAHRRRGGFGRAVGQC